MPDQFIQRLSAALTRHSLTAIFLLWLFAISMVTVLDFTRQKKHIENQIHAIIASSENVVIKAIVGDNKEGIQDIVVGLANYEILHHVSVIDAGGQTLAIYDEATSHSETSWLTSLLRSPSSTRHIDLIKSSGANTTNQKVGTLTLKINNDLALGEFYVRSTIILLIGSVGTLVLGIFLVWLNHLLVSRPLFKLAKSLDSLPLLKNEATFRIPHIKNHEDNEIGYIVDAVNNLLTKLKAREHDVEQSEKQLRLILNTSPNQVFALNHNNEFVFLNSKTAIFYRKTIKSLEGKNFFTTHSSISRHQAHELLKHIQRAQQIYDGSHRVELALKNTEGKQFVAQFSFIPYFLHNQRCVLIIANDVTARVTAEHKINALAYFDTLTQLPNRNQIQGKIREDIIQSNRTGCYGALLFIDIDNFKRINDTLGHNTGDTLLLKLSNRMQTQIRKSETLARLGGDEFVLSVPTVATELDKAIELVSVLAERLLKTIRQPCHLGAHELEVSASIGIAFFPKSGDEVDKLFSAADIAMYQAKREGQDRFAIFKPQMSEEANRLVEMEGDIRKAIANHQFGFYLQPQFDSRTRELVGAEALLRWLHPEKGQILPNEFIAYLETSPMISKVGEIILNQVCAFIYSCKNRGLMSDNTRIAINVCAREFYQPDFVSMVTNCLGKYHLHGSCLEIEITEGAALLYLDQALDTMHQLKELGILFALDDFGTGYSSLSYLKQLPISKIKIDRSFIKDVTFDHQDAMLVASIIAIADTLNLQVVAEGVESEDQAAWLNSQGHIQFQGFLFDKAMPIKEFETHYLDQNPTMALPID